MTCEVGCSNQDSLVTTLSGCSNALIQLQTVIHQVGTDCGCPGRSLPCWVPLQLHNVPGLNHVFRSNYRFPEETRLTPHSSESEAILASQCLA